jgi:hypothetical protein
LALEGDGFLEGVRGETNDRLSLRTTVAKDRVRARSSAGDLDQGKEGMPDSTSVIKPEPRIVPLSAGETAERLATLGQLGCRAVGDLRKVTVRHPGAYRAEDFIVRG